uniref:Uncharacterized protein n=1 Tax=Rhizophora mucronata TaxID=61149 RepID=A0A2P2PAW3_RHIMU
MQQVFYPNTCKLQLMCILVMQKEF